MDVFKKIFRRIITLLIIGILLYQLYDVGWIEVLNSLPTHPLFYLLFAILFITLPLAEVFIYGQVWDVKKTSSFKAFITKKVYNEEVVGYSGELYLFVWARRFLNKDEKEILKNIRDNTILSAITSNLVAFVLVGILIFTGFIELSMLVDNVNLLYIGGGVFIAIIVAALVVQFRKYLFDLPFKKALLIFIIYLSRFSFHHALLIVQWAVVIPETQLSIWIIFVTIVVIVNRIPFLPSKDLVFMWAGIELSRTLNMATASVAGMLLVSSALNKVTNLILYMWISYRNEQPVEIEKTESEK